MINGVKNGKKCKDERNEEDKDERRTERMSQDERRIDRRKMKDGENKRK